MKKSEHNLMVINNFIDYYTSSESEREQMKQEAANYIKEDHADGEDMPENENVIFTTADMRKAFVAGESFESDTWLASEEGGEITEPDFGDWMGQTYNVKID